MMDDILAEKKRLRAEILKTRSEIPEEKITRDSGVIIEKLKSLESYRNSSTVMCFVDFRKEVMTRAFLQHSLDLGKRVLVPLVLKEDDGNRSLKACHLLDLGEDLAPGTMGILEPKPEKRRFTDPAEIDFFVVPGVAFDVFKNRLGYGAGFHDVLLKKLRPDCDTTAVCFDFQVFDRIPIKEYDVPVGRILTELRTIA